MLIKQTTRYTLPTTTPEEYKEARKFADGVDAFYGWGGAQVRITELERMMIVEYDHFIETKDTVFGG